MDSEIMSRKSNSIEIVLHTFKGFGYIDDITFVINCSITECDYGFKNKLNNCEFLRNKS